ncbi:beta-phosphoglucomutase PgmB [Butyrivibrio proteoclasticus B316]|uniref:Beta-phosphoglucomutase n=1 Tax=Butyrivibrio proteoclasticus (strain ATCC 51982 / DSM 14932 / B316) TaxID=515622 RepID=E0S1I0_BUTPB|nr:beta-phosphoglucomutase [Butyrivibrio proteoclasticus]ADL33655.1 beta-phosphoglucomutase PgmB [Butyrivibrio proteoclasticus B316]
MGKMNIKGIIFDLDGVICSTDEYHYQAWKSIADDEGIYFDRKINERLRGVSRAESLEIILERAAAVYSPEEKAALMEKKNNIYRELLKNMGPGDVTEEVRSTLRELKERGYGLAIGSSSKNTRFILERTALTDAFDGISDGNMISRSKPDPEVFIKAAGILGLKNEECFVIEDAISGINAANAAGFHSVGIGPAAECDEAEFKISFFSEILDI